MVEKESAERVHRWPKGFAQHLASGGALLLCDFKADGYRPLGSERDRNLAHAHLRGEGAEGCHACHFLPQ
jgi:hypothetical protein